MKVFTLRKSRGENASSERATITALNQEDLDSLILGKALALGEDGILVFETDEEELEAKVNTIALVTGSEVEVDDGT